VTIYLIRHAKAGSRKDWEGPDALRPLSSVGHRQAHALADVLVGIDAMGDASAIKRILASPFVRCGQTVQPIANLLGLPIESTSELAEDATAEQARSVLEQACAADTDTVLCSHGNIVGELLAVALREGAEGLGVRLEGIRIEKASTWVLTVDAGLIIDTRYLPPPA
jgi:8-oxo-dGTP diphosphatase